MLSEMNIDDQCPIFNLKKSKRFFCGSSSSIFIIVKIDIFSFKKSLKKSNRVTSKRCSLDASLSISNIIVLEKEFFSSFNFIMSNFKKSKYFSAGKSFSNILNSSFTRKKTGLLTLRIAFWTDKHAITCKR